MLIPSHLIYVLKREISSVPQLHKTSPCFSSQLGLCCLPDTWQKVHATQLLPVCHKIWKTRESHCPATILPTIAWPRSAFAAEYCPDRSCPLNNKKKKKKLVTDCLMSSHILKVKLSYINAGVQQCRFFAISTQPAVQLMQKQCSQQERTLSCRTSWSPKANGGITMDH